MIYTTIHNILKRFDHNYCIKRYSWAVDSLNFLVWQDQRVPADIVFLRTSEKNGKLIHKPSIDRTFLHLVIEIFPIFMNLVCWPSFVFVSPFNCWYILWWCQGICQNKVIQLPMNFDVKKYFLFRGLLSKNRSNGWGNRLEAPFNCTTMPKIAFWWCKWNMVVEWSIIN